MEVESEVEESEPQIEVKDALLENAKAYLAQYSDFPKSGVQG